MIYFPYLFVSGPFVWFAALELTCVVKFALLPHLRVPLSAMVWVVVIPGILNILLGTFQWYLIALGIRRLRKLTASRI